MIGNISLCKQNLIELGKKENLKKDKYEYCDVSILLSLLGVNYCQHLLHITNKVVYINSRENVLINFKMDTWFTPRYMLTSCSKNKLTDALEKN